MEAIAEVLIECLQLRQQRPAAVALRRPASRWERLCPRRPRWGICPGGVASVCTVVSRVIIQESACECVDVIHAVGSRRWHGNSWAPLE